MDGSACVRMRYVLVIHACPPWLIGRNFKRRLLYVTDIEFDVISGYNCSKSFACTGRWHSLQNYRPRALESAWAQETIHSNIIHWKWNWSLFAPSLSLHLVRFVYVCKLYFLYFCLGCSISLHIVRLGPTFPLHYHLNTGVNGMLNKGGYIHILCYARLISFESKFILICPSSKITVDWRQLIWNRNAGL